MLADTTVAGGDVAATGGGFLLVGRSEGRDRSKSGRYIPIGGGSKNLLLAGLRQSSRHCKDRQMWMLLSISIEYRGGAVSRCVMPSPRLAA